MLPAVHALLLALAPDPDLADELAASAAPLVEAQVVHGLVLGWIDAEGNRGTRSVGRRSRDDPRPPDADSLFEIGSVTKVLTGLLLACAVDRGEVALESEVNALLPDDWRLPVTAPPVRLVDLATHTAGMPEVPTNLGRDVSRFVVDYSGYDEERLREFARSFAPDPPVRALYVYSNAGFGLLGHALALHAGLPFGDLLARDVTGPLGLGSTSAALDDAARARLVQGHDPNGDPVEHAGFGSLVACGGVVSSARDLLALLAAYLDDASPLARPMLLTREPHARTPSRVGVGLAWHVALDGVTRFHDGRTGGFASFVAFDPARRTAAVVLANTSTDRVAALGLDLVRVLAGVEPTSAAPRVPASIEAADLDGLAGTYEASIGISLEVTRAQDRLYARIPGQPSWRVWPVGGDAREFFYRDVEATLTFERGAAAPAARVVLHQNGRDIAFDRAD